jgi:paraquat-inducible protein B
LSESETNLEAPAPQVKRTSRWNFVWVVPVVALLLGVWLMWNHFTSKGAAARVRFETAEEIFAGRTEVRCRSVRVGTVKDVELAADLKSVTVHLDINEDAEHLLRRGSRFWVVKPRVSGGSITGLNTIIQGAYIELDPDMSSQDKETDFVGLETPPTTSMSVPGLRIVLATDEAGLLTEGSPIYYRGFEVGRIESRALVENGASVRYDAFIREEHAPLVTTNTRFWNTSGIDISAGADGFQVRTPSLQAMVSGGVSFGVPQGEEPGELAKDGRVFTLQRDQDKARSATFSPTRRILLLFDQSVRGLSKRAMVEFRGIPIGRVLDISFDLAEKGKNPSIPVLIEIDARIMEPGLKQEEDAAREEEFLIDAVRRGMRASLKTGSLITGALYVDLDYYEDAVPAVAGKSGEYLTIPTISSGFAQFETKLAAILDKLNALPMQSTMEGIAAAASEAEATMAESRETLAELKSAVVAARTTLEDPALRSLPDDVRKSLATLEKTVESIGPAGAVQGDLLRSLDELRAALRSMKQLTHTIDEKPNSLLFGRESSGNPVPRAPRGGR